MWPQFKGRFICRYSPNIEPADLCVGDNLYKSLHKEIAKMVHLRVVLITPTVSRFLQAEFICKLLCQFLLLNWEVGPEKVVWIF